MNEASEFRDALKKFEDLNTAIVGCSGDSVESQTKFKVKHKLTFPLLADTEFEVIEAYGARRMKSFLGKSFLGIVRMTYWIGPDGKIRTIWDKVTPKGHAAEVLEKHQRQSLESFWQRGAVGVTVITLHRNLGSFRLPARSARCQSGACLPTLAASKT